MAQLHVARVYVGTFMTSLDMSGFSLSVLVLDEERAAYLDAPTQVCAPWPLPGLEEGRAARIGTL